MLGERSFDINSNVDFDLVRFWAMKREDPC